MKIQSMKILMILLHMMTVDTTVIVIVEYLACMILSTQAILKVSRIVKMRGTTLNVQKNPAVSTKSR